MIDTIDIKCLIIFIIIAAITRYIITYINLVQQSIKNDEKSPYTKAFNDLKENFILISSSDILSALIFVFVIKKYCNNKMNIVLLTFILFYSIGLYSYLDNVVTIGDGDSGYKLILNTAVQKSTIFACIPVIISAYVVCKLF